jgi:hypothetical protein
MRHDFVDVYHVGILALLSDHDICGLRGKFAVDGVTVGGS